MKQIFKHTLNGTIHAPASKSMYQRYLALSSLSSSEVIIQNPSICDDGLAALEIMKTLKSNDLLSGENKICINCNESGTSFRLFSAICACRAAKFTLNAHGSLKTRTMQMVQDSLIQYGVKCESNNGFPPLNIQGPINCSTITVDGSITSQFLSGLLIATPTLSHNTTIFVKNLKSKPYIYMTLEALSDFGIKIEYKNDLSEFYIKGNQTPNANSLTVEGDWSGASFILVAGALAGKVTVKGLKSDSSQADRAIMEALKKANAKILLQNSDITIETANLIGFEFDATHCPDLFPPLVALAAGCNGISTITGANRLIHKESNRASALKNEYQKLSIEIEHYQDKLIVHGSKPIPVAETDSHQDHRIAMSLAVAALRSDKAVTITNESAISKSYPSFFNDLESLYE